MSSKEFRKPPEEVYFVSRIPAPGEAKKYYDIKYNRLYQGVSGVKQFMAAHPGSEFTVMHSPITWTSVDPNDL